MQGRRYANSMILVNISGLTCAMERDQPNLFTSVTPSDALFLLPSTLNGRISSERAY